MPTVNPNTRVAFNTKNSNRNIMIGTKSLMGTGNGNAHGKSIYMNYHDAQQVLFVLLLRFVVLGVQLLLFPSTFLNNLSNCI